MVRTRTMWSQPSWLDNTVACWAADFEAAWELRREATKEPRERAVRSDHLKVGRYLDQDSIAATRLKVDEISTVNWTTVSNRAQLEARLSE